MELYCDEICFENCVDYLSDIEPYDEENNFSPIVDIGELNLNIWPINIRLLRLNDYFFMLDRKHYENEKYYQMSLFKTIYICDSCGREDCNSRYCEGRDEKEDKYILYNENLSTNFLDSLLKYHLVCKFYQNNHYLLDEDILNYFNNVSKYNYIFLNIYFNKNLSTDVLIYLYDFI